MPPKYTAEELFERLGPGSLKGAKKLAKQYGVDPDEMGKFFEEKGRSKDANLKTGRKQVRELGMPIYSQTRGTWQFDTVVPKDHKAKDNYYYLWFSNVNTRMTRAYKMTDKSASEVARAMQLFLDDNKKANMDVKKLECDEDKAYTDDKVLSILKDNQIRLRTTDKTHKHALGVLNRSIRTIRNRIANTYHLSEKELGNMPPEQVDQKLSGWNNQPLDDFDGKSPAQASKPEGEETELDIIATKMMKADERREKGLKDVKVGQHVRRFNPDVLNGYKQHAQMNLDPYNWIIHKIDPRSATLYLGGKDPKAGLVQVPRFQVLTDPSYLGGKNKLVPHDNKDLKKEIEAITSKQKHGAYTVRYTDGTEEKKTVRELRGREPTNPLQMEVDLYMNDESSKKRMSTRRGGDVFANMPVNIKDYLYTKMPDLPKVKKEIKEEA